MYFLYLPSEPPTPLGDYRITINCFYVVGVQFQAQFIAPILILFVLLTYLKTGFLMRIILSGIVSLVIIQVNAEFIKRFSTENHSEQLRQLFDIAGVSVAINNDDLVPKYVKEDKKFI